MGDAHAYVRVGRRGNLGRGKRNAREWGRARSGEEDIGMKRDWAGMRFRVMAPQDRDPSRLGDNTQVRF
jgi:hypothetical protein